MCNINNESLDSQINRLANFIMESIKGEPSKSEGAVDCAIRIMTEMKQRAEKAEIFIKNVCFECPIEDFAKRDWCSQCGVKRMLTRTELARRAEGDGE